VCIILFGNWSPIHDHLRVLILFGGPTEILKKQIGAMDICVSCKKEVMDDDRAMVGDLSDKWEHVGCLKHSNKLTKCRLET